MSDKEKTRPEDPFHFAKQAWHELESASYNKSKLISIDEVREKIQTNERDLNAISVGYIDYQFNFIADGAFDNGSLYLGEDSMLYDGEGNPYDIDTLLFPFISTDAFEGDSLTLYFDPDLILSNTSRTIDQITINLGNKKLSLALGALETIYVGDISDSTVEVNIIMSSGPDELQWFNPNDIYGDISFNQFRIPPNIFDQNTCVKDEEIWSGEDLTFMGYDENQESQGFGNYRIFYRQINNSWAACVDDVIKPIIILDGFDPEDKRPIEPVTHDLNKKDAIWKLLLYDNNKKHLGDTLRKLGYDVIVLNFPVDSINGVYRDGGTDYIERNAMVLVKLIQGINQQLDSVGSDEEIVIIGPSMGGQIARYALAYMEDKASKEIENMNHNTRLFVSFDSPHFGANIPISIQQLMWHLGVGLNNTELEDKYNTNIRSYAARQMLIEQMDGLNRSAEYHEKYYNDLTENGLTGSEGWPLNLRKISLINGNAKGIRTNNVGEKVLGLSANVGLSITAIEFELYNMEYKGQSNKTYKGRAKKNLSGWNWPNYSYFSHTTGSYFTNNMHLYSKGALTEFNILYQVAFYELTNNFTVYNDNSNGVMDVVPGGTFNTFAVLRHEINQEIIKKGSGVRNESIDWYSGNKKAHSFIPSVSALALNNQYSSNWGTAFDDRNLVCTGEIPFDAYFVAQEKEEHVFISNEAAEWVLNEILSDGGQHFVKNMIDPHENDLMPICINEFRTIHHNYIIEPCMDVTWSIAPNSGLQIVSSDDEKVVLKGNSQVEDVEVSYKIKNNQGDSIVESFIFDVGFNPGYIGMTYFRTIANAYIINYEPNSYTYHWKLDNNNWELANDMYYSENFLNASSTNPSTLYLKTENACNSYVDATNVTTIALPELKDTIVVTPNPTNSYWNVAFLNSAEKQIALYTIDGRELYKEITDKTEVRVSAEHLPTGIYMLKVRYGEVEKIVKLVKQ